MTLPTQILTIFLYSKTYNLKTKTGRKFDLVYNSHHSMFFQIKTQIIILGLTDFEFHGFKLEKLHLKKTCWKSRGDSQKKIYIYNVQSKLIFTNLVKFAEKILLQGIFFNIFGMLLVHLMNILG